MVFASAMALGDEVPQTARGLYTPTPPIKTDHPNEPTDWYTGLCPHTGELLRLPRTRQAEATAQALMAELGSESTYTREGKMFGILLVETPTGERAVLKAFSGLLAGHAEVEGWVPPIAGRSQIALAERQTLSQLDEIRAELLTLKTLPERKHLADLMAEFDQQRQALLEQHRQRKHQRHTQRQQALTTLAAADLTDVLSQLKGASQRDGMELRHFKRQWAARLASLQSGIATADNRSRFLKQRRKALSRQLQTQMHATYSLTNFAGESVALQAFKAASGLPTGTGDCCAPKLLHYAATHHLRPIAMAEFWWGTPSPQGDKQPGHFYTACRERCQPLMGFLLSGLTLRPPVILHSSPTSPVDEASGAQNGSEDMPPTNPPLTSPIELLYADSELIAVNKPSGLLSVPGRTCWDSVLSYLQSHHPTVIPIHRLDQDTSGILVFACNPTAHQHLSQQFQHRQVTKTYEAILNGCLAVDAGEINLPLWGNPAQRPRQQVNWQQGKPSTTQFYVRSRTPNLTQVEFRPLTGRTHQLRVHAADPQGLGIPILGDRLYGNPDPHYRLQLHAHHLVLQHPKTGQSLALHAPLPEDFRLLEKTQN